MQWLKMQEGQDARMAVGIFRFAQDARAAGCWMAMVEIFRFAQDAGWLRMGSFGSGCRMVMVEIFRFAQDAGWLKMLDGSQEGQDAGRLR
jgi:hypothetical protein